MAPRPPRPLLGLDALGDARLIGAVDLALSPGLVLGRPRWPWAAVRILANVLTAGLALRRSRTTPAAPRAHRAAILLGLATAADTLVLRNLLADR